MDADEKLRELSAALGNEHRLERDLARLRDVLGIIAGQPTTDEMPEAERSRALLAEAYDWMIRRARDALK